MSTELTSSQDGGRWLTLGEAAGLLGIHDSTLRSWADRGEIPVFRTPGGHRRFRLADLRQFLQSRSAHEPSATIDAVMAQALGRVRQEIASIPPVPGSWRSSQPAEARESNRERGRRLFALALNYLIRPEQRTTILEAGRVLGREYGEEAARGDISLAETGRAVQFFRRQLLDAVRRDESLDPEDVEIRQTIASFLDEVLYAVLEGYEDAAY